MVDFKNIKKPTPLLEEIKKDVVNRIKDDAEKIAVKVAHTAATEAVNKIKQEALKMEDKKWFQSKTVWTGIAGVIGGVGGFLTGTMDPGTAVQTVIGSLMGIFIRSGAGVALK